MTLNDPPIELSLLPWTLMQQKESLLSKFDFLMYNKCDYYCIDGFLQEGKPCVVVLPPPTRSGYVYQGIKPAILPVPNPSAEIIEHVKSKQEEMNEKARAKR